MKKIRCIKNLFIVLLSLCLVITGGCGKQSEDNVVQKNYLYYRSSDGKSVFSVEVDLEEKNGKEAVSYCLEKLGEKPDGGQKLLPQGVSLNGYQVDGNTVTLDFSKAYKNMDKVTELLVRSGYVRTLVEISDIDYVTFEVEGKTLTDESGNALGLMSADTFIENAGKSVNNYQYNEITLYFTDINGHALVSEGRAIYYSSNKSLEWAIVERLIAGPKVTGHVATVSPDTQILSVTSQDGTCYVNLDQSFETGVLSVDAQVSIYSIVDSLIQNCDVSKVQISVNGVNSVVYGNQVDLNQSFEMNREIISES